MNKIILNASLAIIISAGAISAANAEPFKGPYASIDLGVQKNKFKSKTSGVAVTSRNKQTVPITTSAGYSSVAANGIYTAIEGGLSTTFRKDGTSFSPGLSTKVGYRVHERIVIAGTASVVYNKYGFKNSLGNVTTKSKFGFAPGVEGLFAVNDKIILGLGYQYMRNNSFKFRDPILGDVKVQPSGHKVAAKLAYKF